MQNLFLSITRRSNSKIWKIWLSLFKLKIRRPIKHSDSRSRVHHLITRATVSGISIQLFSLWLLSRSDQAPLSTTVNISVFCLFLLYFADGSFTTSYSIFCLKWQLEVAYTHTHTHKLTHINFLPTIYYICRLLISSHRKSYWQYFDILLKYKKLEICCYKGNKSMSQ